MESVWDYPRPPKLESFKGHVRVRHNGQVIADSNRVFRILETSHPPTYYIPISDIKNELFRVNKYSTFCEYKGQASYMDLVMENSVVSNVGWFYRNPSKAYAELKDHLCIYASTVNECYVNDELVEAQDGDFYGGWITSNIKGPFKGGVGTYGW